MKSLSRKALAAGASLAIAAFVVSACDRGDATRQSAPVTAEAFKRKDVILYLPDREMARRVEMSDLSPYMRALEAAVGQAVDAVAAQPGASGVLLVMVKPDGRSRAWMVTGQPEMAQAVSQSVIAAAEAVETPPVRNGPILMGLAFEAWGGGTAPGGNTAPIPQDWYAHFPPHGGALDDAMLARIWPD